MNMRIGYPKKKRTIIGLCLLFLLVGWQKMCAQESLTVVQDTIYVSLDDSTLQTVRQITEDLNLQQHDSMSFNPNPNKAVIMAAVFPGLGQIYNRQYWKLPLVYGGFMGFIYAITWNNKNYSDYSQAYLA